ncbi:MAG: 3-isopropylmalate dehydratase small subunit [Candidatus Obscuribacterales bacterium]
MDRFVKVKSKAVPVRYNDLDTDQIIPAQFLTSVDRSGYGANLFRRLKDSDPEFPFNQAACKGASIMLTGANFGCGSSREHAVWAITGAGIKVVVAESFADIFFNNSAKNGLLLVELPKEAIDRLAEDQGEIEVDLESQTVKNEKGESFSFDYDPFRKHCLLEGLDDIDYIMSMEAAIDSHRENARKDWMKSLNMETSR